MSMAAVIIVQSTDLHVCFVPWSFLDTLLVLSYQEVILLRDFIILRFTSTQLTRHFCTLYYLIYLDFTTLSVFFFLDTVSQCSHSWTRIHSYVSAPASHVLRLNACLACPVLSILFKMYFHYFKLCVGGDVGACECSACGGQRSWIPLELEL